MQVTSQVRSKVHALFLLIVTFLLLICCSGWEQAQAQERAQAPPQVPQGPKAKPDGEGAAAPAQPAKKISRQEVEELFRSVDAILKFASQDTGLPIRQDIKRRLTSRDEVVAYVEKHMQEDEDARRLQRSEIVLKKFGLLPRDFDLRQFLLALLREQVAGYYDPKTKTVNLLDWVDIEQQRPVLAHELTHALQDQSFGLQKWMKAGIEDLEVKKDLTPEDINNDELQTARQAVVEGQAMAVLVDYMLAPTGQSLTTAPQIVEALKQGMLVGTADSVHFRTAPIFLKEVLTFPYRYGLDFVTEVLVKQGKNRAFASVFANPPRSTRQIMEPGTYLAGESIPPMPLPDFSRLLKSYERFDVGSMGEFDVALLVDQYEGVDTSRRLYPEWRGGYYYACRPKGDPAAPLALLYVSRWSSAEGAAEFARIYANSLKQRYRSMRVLKPPAEKPPGNGDAEAMPAVREWLTEDGNVIIATQEDLVFVSESFDEATNDALRRSVFATSRLAAAAQ